MFEIKFYFVFLIFILSFHSFCQGNDYFNCLENSDPNNNEFCKSHINKWDRLPQQIRPLKYTIVIQPFIHLANESNFYFRGSVRIDCQSDISHRYLFLHSGSDLNLQDASIKVVDNDRRPRRIKSVSYINSRKWVVIKFEKKIPVKQKFTIKIKHFSSKFAKSTHGLYFFSFKIDNVKSYGANSLFSPFYARNAFPCFDDPIFETPIQLNLIRRDYMVSQSIMEIEKTTALRNGWEVDTFEWTPAMQIYQFSFSVNTFDYISVTTKTNQKIRLWAPPEKLHLCTFSLNKIKTALEFYQNYFNTSYAFDKLDVVVTSKMPPYETGSSTYGLLIFLDSVIFVEDEKVLPRMKQIYINTINHEVAHQWIGNTLRIEWFDGLWVIEGLVGYMEQKIRTHETQYQHRMSTALTQTLTGLYADDMELNHKLAIYPYSAKHVEFYFDDLIFTKGFSMFKMIEGVVGKRDFQYALQTIIKNDDLAPITSNGLWHLMDEALKDTDRQITIEYLMKSWQSKRGFPIVHAARHGDKEIKLNQRSSVFTNIHFLWPIPITYLTKNGEEVVDHKSIIWFHERHKTLHLAKKLADDDWFILNHEQLGFYRVNYDMSNWILLIHELQTNHTAIPPIARLQIFDDIFQFYCNGEIPGGNTMFDVLTYLEKETQFTIWKYSKIVINFLHSLLSKRDSFQYFKSFINKLIGHMLKKVQWTRNKHQSLSSQMQDKLMFEYACRYDHTYCQERTNEYFNYWLDNYKFIAPLYLYGPILCNGIKRGHSDVWYRVLNSLTSKQISLDQKLTVAISLTCSTDQVVLGKYWSLISTKKSKFKSLFSALLTGLARNINARFLFEKHLCSDSLNITKNPFEFAATLAALNNFVLPDNCQAIHQLQAVRFKRSSGDNLETESALITDLTRKTIRDKHLHSLERWLHANVHQT